MKRLPALRGLNLLVVVLGALALVVPILSILRPLAPDDRARVDIAVTSSADRGPGTLREAIYTANSALGRTRIRIEVPAVELRTALPPLVNPDGVILVSPVRGTIDASRVTEGPALDVRARGSIVRNVGVVGAPVVGLAVGADGVLVDSVRIERNATGIAHLSGAAFTVQNSAFVSNGIGLSLDAERAEVNVRDNSFQGNVRAGVWSMGPADPGDLSARGIVVASNTFEGDRISMVVRNRSVLVTDNDFVRALEAAVHVGGEGVRVESNRILAGISYGILAFDALGAEITGNEADGNRAVGILVNSSRNVLIRDNRAYRNGYGIVSVFGDARSPVLFASNTSMANDFDGLTIIGGSPVLRDNLASGNGLAGLRILDFQPLSGGRLAASPLLDQNRIRGNGVDEPVRGVYVVRPGGGQ